MARLVLDEDEEKKNKPRLVLDEDEEFISTKPRLVLDEEQSQESQSVIDRFKTAAKIAPTVARTLVEEMAAYPFKREELPQPPPIIESAKATLPQFKKGMKPLDTVVEVAKTAALPISLPFAAGGTAIRNIPGVEARLQVAKRGASGLITAVNEGDIQRGAEAIQEGKPFAKSMGEAIQNFVSMGKKVEDLKSPSVIENLFLNLPEAVGETFGEFIDPEQLPGIGAFTGQMALVQKLTHQVPNAVARVILGKATKEVTSKLRKAGYAEPIIEEFQNRVELSKKTNQTDIQKAYKTLKMAKEMEVDPLKPQMEPPEKITAAKKAAETKLLTGPKEITPETSKQVIAESEIVPEGGVPLTAQERGRLSELKELNKKGLLETGELQAEFLYLAGRETALKSKAEPKPADMQIPTPEVKKPSFPVSQLRKFNVVTASGRHRTVKARRAEDIVDPSPDDKIVSVTEKEPGKIAEHRATEFLSQGKPISESFLFHPDSRIGENIAKMERGEMKYTPEEQRRHFNEDFTAQKTGALESKAMSKIARITDSKLIEEIPAIAFDIDKLKYLNDKILHHGSDALIGQLIEKMVKAGLPVVRWSGDEYTIPINPKGEKNSLIEMFQKIEKIMNEAAEFEFRDDNGNLLHNGISISAAYGNDSESALAKMMTVSKKDRGQWVLDKKDIEDYNSIEGTDEKIPNGQTSIGGRARKTLSYLTDEGTDASLGGRPDSGVNLPAKTEPTQPTAEVTKQPKKKRARLLKPKSLLQAMRQKPLVNPSKANSSEILEFEDRSLYSYGPDAVSLDEKRELLAEQGYLEKDTVPSDLTALLHEEIATGKKKYSIQESEAYEAGQQPTNQMSDERISARIEELKDEMFKSKAGVKKSLMNEYLELQEEQRKRFEDKYNREIKKVEDEGYHPGEDPDLLSEKKAEYSAVPFFSGLQKLIEEKMPNRANTFQIKSIIKNAKKEEVEWSGIEEWLKDKTMVTKEQVMDFLKQNEVNVEEVMKGEIDRDLDWKEEKEGSYSAVDESGSSWEILPEGSEFKIYRNGNLYDSRGYSTLEEAQIVTNGERDPSVTKFEKYTIPGGKNYREIVFTIKGLDYEDSHFPGIKGNIGWVRFNERLDSEGNRVLFIEEIQSGLHQEGRSKEYALKREIKNREEIERGDHVKKLGVIQDIVENIDLPVNAKILKTKYGFKVLENGKDVLGKLYMNKAEASKAYHELTGRGESYKQYKINGNWYHQKIIKTEDVEAKIIGVPNAPFKKTWHELVLKRMLRYAAENGFDKVAWTTGEMQAERYDLSKQVGSVTYNQDTGMLTAKDPGFTKTVIQENGVTPEKLEDYIGKEAAEKIMKKTSDNEGDREISGLDLKVGGEGMKGFYDQMIPQFLNKYAKKWGAKVGTTDIRSKPFKGSLTPENMVTIEATGSNRQPYVVKEEGNTVFSGSKDQAEAFAKKEIDVLKKSVLDPVHSLDITPSMKSEALEKGQALFEKPKQYDLPEMPKPEMPAKGIQPKVPQKEDLLGGFRPDPQMELFGKKSEKEIASVPLPEPPKVIGESFIHNELVESGFMPATSLTWKGPETGVDVLYHLKNSDVEKFYIFGLDENDGIIGTALIGIGTANMVAVSPSKVLGVARDMGAKRIVLAHVHPSGEVDPSPEDIALTKSISEAAKILGMEVKEHIIIDHKKFGHIDSEGQYTERKYEEPSSLPLQVRIFDRKMKAKSKGVYDGAGMFSPQDVVSTMKELLDKNKDTVFAIVANIRNKANAIVPISTYDTHGDEIISSVFNSVLNHNGSSVFLVSNGKLNQNVVQETIKKLSQLGVPLLDAVSVVKDVSGLYSKIHSYREESEWMFKEKPAKYEAREPGREPDKQPLTKVEKYFQVDEPFPNVEIKFGEKAGVLSKTLGFFGLKSRGTIIKSSGEAGKTLAKEADMANVLPQAASGRLNKKLKQLANRIKLTKDERLNLGMAKEGFTKPMNASVSEYLEEFKKQTEEIRSLREEQLKPNKFQEELGIVIPELERWGRDDYMPHILISAEDAKPGAKRELIIDGMMKRKNVDSREVAGALIDWWVGYLEHNKTPIGLAEWMIKNGQATDFNDAAQKLARIRDFNKGFKTPYFLFREVNLPFYDPDPLSVFPKYNRAVMEFLYMTERFGGTGAPKLKALIDKIDVAGGNREVATSILNDIIGERATGEYANFARMLRNIQVIEKLSYAGIANYFQGGMGISLLLGPGVTVATKRAIKAKLNRARLWALEVGQNPEMATLLTEDVGDLARRFLKFSRFTKTEIGNYIFATMAGKIGAIRYFQKLKKNPKDILAKRMLEKLDLDTDKLLKQGFLTKIEMKIAANRAWRESQGIPDVLRSPHRWLGLSMDDPGAKLLFQFKSVAYNQTRLVWESAVNDIRYGRIGGFLTLLILFPSIGEIIQDLRAVAHWRERPLGFWVRYLDNLGGAFAFGMISDIYYMGKYGLSLGPTLGQAGELLRPISQAMEGKYKQALKSTAGQVKNVPFVGRAVYNTLIKERKQNRPIPSNIYDILFPKEQSKKEPTGRVKVKREKFNREMLLR